MKLPEHIYCIKGLNKGPIVSIIGALHGNERLGVKIINILKEQLQPQDINGTLFLMIGNPKAYEQNIRFCDYDINRTFGTKLPDDIKESDYEFYRRQDLLPILEKTNFLLDIHATNKPSTPFVYSENTEKHQTFFKLFETDFLVTPTQEFRPKDMVSSVDNFVDRNGGVGITYEAGSCNDEEDIEKVLEKTMRFLSHAGITQHDFKTEIETKHVNIYDEIRVQDESFEFTKDWGNFDFIKKGEIIGYEKNKEYKAIQDTYLIFPKTEFIVGKPAVYLAY